MGIVFEELVDFLYPNYTPSLWVAELSVFTFHGQTGYPKASTLLNQVRSLTALFPDPPEVSRVPLQGVFPVASIPLKGESALVIGSSALSHKYQTLHVDISLRAYKPYGRIYINNKEFKSYRVIYNG